MHVAVLPPRRSLPLGVSSFFLFHTVRVLSSFLSTDEWAENCKLSTSRVEPTNHSAEWCLVEKTVYTDLRSGSVEPRECCVPLADVSVFDCSPNVPVRFGSTPVERQNAISNQFKCKLKTIVAYKLFDSASKYTASEDQTQGKGGAHFAIRTLPPRSPFAVFCVLLPGRNPTNWKFQQDTQDHKGWHFSKISYDPPAINSPN